jgi:hypothetical protein
MTLPPSFTDLSGVANGGYGHEERFPPLRLSAGSELKKRRSAECAATGETRRNLPLA